MDWVKEKMYQARRQRTQIQNQDEVVIPDHQPQKNAKPEIDKTSQVHNSGQTLVLVAASFVSGAAVIGLMWSAHLIDFNDRSAIDGLRGKASLQAQRSIAPPIGYARYQRKSAELGNEIQTNTVSGLESLPPPSAGKTNMMADMETIESGPATPTELQTMSIQTAMPTEMQRETPKENSGAWAINLASLHQQADAERFSAEADSKGVAVEVNQVTVRGKQYWRVQVTGFSSADEAKTKGGEIQDKLGLKDFWIIRK
jgi:cell division septation protein DedD